jgi:hypothetical protein
MKPATLPSFWDASASLDEGTQRRAKKAFGLWTQNPFHPSLQFKCINRAEGLWSVRISRGSRAVGVLEEDSVTWFWIGHHGEYERFFS